MKILKKDWLDSFCHSELKVNCKAREYPLGDVLESLNFPFFTKYFLQNIIMKTIKDLNQKIWYRLLKVVYIFIFCLIIIFLNIFLVEELNMQQKATEVLKSLWIETEDTENKVKQDIQQKKSTTFSQNEFFKDVNILMRDNNINHDTAFDATLKYYKSKWYNIEWVDIDEELNILSWVWDTPTSEELPVKEEKKWFLEKSLWIFLNTIVVFVFSGLMYLIFFQWINRVFYYILLGTLRPKND